MNGPGRSVLAALVFGAILPVAAGADAATYPDHTIRILVGYPSGGGTDLLARLLGKSLSDSWKQPVVVENRPGADGSIAEDVVAHAAPDGYTLIFASSSHTITPSRYKLNYDPVKSFAPITMVAAAPDVLLVNPSVPANSLKELIAFAKADPGKLNIGIPGGSASSAYLETELFLKSTGINMVTVPYQGSADSMVGLLGGAVQVGFEFGTLAGPQVAAGKLKALAVGSTLRSPVLPDVPTVADAAGLPAFDASNWTGVLAPAGTPPAVIAALNHQLVDAIRTPDMQKTFVEHGYATIADSPEDFAKKIDAELIKWGNLIKAIDTHP